MGIVRLLLSRILNFLYWRTRLQIFRVISNKLARGVVVNVGLWRMVLSDISDLAMTRPEYEWRSFKWLMTKILSLKKRNFVFIDVGASIGRYSLMIA